MTTRRSLLCPHIPGGFQVEWMPIPCGFHPFHMESVWLRAQPFRRKFPSLFHMEIQWNLNIPWNIALESRWNSPQFNPWIPHYATWIPYIPYGFHIMLHEFHIFHMDSTLFHMDSILFHMDSILFHMDSILFHMDSILFHMDSILFHMDSILF